VEVKGNWYYHPNLPTGKIQGADQFADFVKRDEVARAEVTAAIMAHLKEHAHEVAPIMNPENAEMPVGELFRQDPFDA